MENKNQGAVMADKSKTRADGDAIDSKAFEILVREHHRRWLAYALSLVTKPTQAEDLVQEALLVAYRKLDSFDTSHNFSNWVRGIIKNKYYEMVRKENCFVLDEKQIESLDHAHSFWDTYDADEINPFQILKKCIEKLPELLHQSIDTFYMQELTYAESATVLECNEATLRKRMQRGREELGKCMKAAYKEDES